MLYGGQSDDTVVATLAGGTQLRAVNGTICSPPMMISTPVRSPLKEYRGSYVMAFAPVLQGPTGTWTVSVGDTVPGAGRIGSIVRWGSRWIVATSKGLN